MGHHADRRAGVIDSRNGYGMTEEYAQSVGAPVCPECCRYVDGMSEHLYFMLDVVVARCTDCRLWTVIGGDRWLRCPNPRAWWVRVPFVGPFIHGRLSGRFARDLNAMAQAVSERQKAARRIGGNPK
jgi:hypothetical protein